MKTKQKILPAQLLIKPKAHMPEEQNFFKDTKQKLEQYIQQRILLLRLQATEKISKIASAIITSILLVIVLLFVLFFASITAGFWLSDLTNSLIAGFGIVALFYLLVFLFIIIFLRKILQSMFINKLIRLFHKKD
ncbi:MAG TPA: phage holin family protein [Parafilimonas sp.]|nr:phage holin family protein [Parafilimonas sp.]